jgi:hypothetical protein
VVGTFRRVEFRDIVFEELVIESQSFAGVKGGFEGIVVIAAANVFKKLIDGIVVLEHGVIVFAGADEMGERELFAGEIKLKGVGEGDLERIILAAGAAFKKVFAFFGVDKELGGAAGTTGIFLHGLNRADVKVTHHNDKFLGGESFPVAHGVTISD